MFAIFYTKVHDRVLKPLFATGQPRRQHPCAPHSAQSNTKSTNTEMRPGCPPHPEKLGSTVIPLATKGSLGASHPVGGEFPRHCYVPPARRAAACAPAAEAAAPSPRAACAPLSDVSARSS